MITELHEQRLETVFRILVESGARSVLDLGCGAGALLERLARERQFEKIVGVDTSSASLLQARGALREPMDAEPGRISVVAGSYTDRDPALVGFDACAMVETIEHIDPGKLSRVERTVFGCYRPRTLVMTTPNAEFNTVFGLARNEFREPDHRFEWDRAKFRAWATGVAQRNGYRVGFRGIGERDAVLGQPTQMAVFTRRDEAGTPHPSQPNPPHSPKRRTSG